MLYHFIVGAFSAVFCILCIIGIIGEVRDSGFTWELLIVLLIVVFLGLITWDEFGAIAPIQYGLVVKSSNIPTSTRLTVSSGVLLLRGDDGYTYVVSREVIPDSLICDSNKVTFGHEKLLSGESQVTVSGTACPKH